VLVSAVEQSESVVCIHVLFFRFFSHIGYCRALLTVLFLSRKVLSVFFPPNVSGFRREASYYSLYLSFFNFSTCYGKFCVCSVT